MIVTDYYPDAFSSLRRRDITYSMAVQRDNELTAVELQAAEEAQTEIVQVAILKLTDYALSIWKERCDGQPYAWGTQSN